MDSQIVQKVLVSIWAAADSDGDGLLDRAEFVHLLCVTNIVLHQQQNHSLLDEDVVSELYLKAEHDGNCILGTVFEAGTLACFCPVLS